MIILSQTHFHEDIGFCSLNLCQSLSLSSATTPWPTCNILYGCKEAGPSRGIEEERRDAGLLQHSAAFCKQIVNLTEEMKSQQVYSLDPRKPERSCPKKSRPRQGCRDEAEGCGVFPLPAHRQARATPTLSNQRRINLNHFKDKTTTTTGSPTRHNWKEIHPSYLRSCQSTNPPYSPSSW